MCIRDSNTGLLWLPVKATTYGLPPRNQLPCVGVMAALWNESRAVSYTHLDAWTRDQERMRLLGDRQYQHAIKLFDTATTELTGPLACTSLFLDMARGIPIIGLPGERTWAAAPVSDTHLDVYKRQHQCRSFTFRCGKRSTSTPSSRSASYSSLLAWPRIERSGASR